MILRYKISPFKKFLFPLLIFAFSLGACSDNVGLARINRDLYARYPVRFLHASVQKKTLHILMYRNADSLSRSQWEQNALDVARFILFKKNYNLRYSSLGFRYQSISAQVVITDPHAVTFHFNADSLKNSFSAE